MNKKTGSISDSQPAHRRRFVWDGENEAERPLTRKEMLAGIRNKGGRPVSGNPKKITTIRLDARILEFFKSRGKGWQTRINDVLEDYINSHPKV